MAGPPFDLSGEWRITDSKGNVFEYTWEHKAGQVIFDGTQKGGGLVIGEVKGGRIQWEVNNVRCKGELTGAGTRIMCGSYSNKDDGQTLGTFNGEKMTAQNIAFMNAQKLAFASEKKRTENVGSPSEKNLNLSGTWQITDGKGYIFEYDFEHKTGERRFKGSQKGGKEVSGHVKGNVIEWEVAAVCCKGELSSSGTRISNGTYWKKSTGKHLGTFVGKNLGESAGEKGKSAKKRKRSSSSERRGGKNSKRRSPSSSMEKAIKAVTDSGTASDNPEIAKGKEEALQELHKIKLTESKEARRAEFKSLLRRWHPDKNMDRQEVATAVFQFLLKGKRLLKGT